MILALRETCHGRASIAKDHAARAVLIEQRAQKFFASTRASFFERKQMGFETFLIAVENLFKCGVISVGQRLFFDDLSGDFGDGAKALGFIDEGFVIVVAVRIEQTQTREVSG